MCNENVILSFYHHHLSLISTKFEKNQSYLLQCSELTRLQNLAEGPQKS
jgi:hypothetical protein